jgi:hypothetical protein
MKTYLDIAIKVALRAGVWQEQSPERKQARTQPESLGKHMLGARVILHTGD